MDGYPYGPAEFIRVAEKSGLIVRLGRIAVEQSIKFLKDVEDETGKVLSCSINLSAMQMSDLTFYDFLKETLTKYNVKPTQIVIEMTESVFFSDNNQLKMLLNNFYKDKIRLALDDFGSGYSSINNLTKYKFTCVKFDKGIIDSMLARGDISNLINLVHSYGYIVLAEGVETAEQLEYLKKEKCDYIQGYYFSKPVSKEEIISKYIDKIK